MSYGDPIEMLHGALAEFPENRERFEADYAHFLTYSGVPWWADTQWIRWAFWSAGDYGRKG